MSNYTKFRNKNRGYMKLDVWTKSIQLLKTINKLIHGKSLPFKISAQILDSAQSVSSNIAEGYCRRHLNEYIQYCYIALASLGETLTRSIGLKEMGTLTNGEFEVIDKLHYEVENKLLSLVKALERKRYNKSWNDRISDSDQDSYSTQNMADYDDINP